jgi:zinc finger protein 830
MRLQKFEDDSSSSKLSEPLSKKRKASNDDGDEQDTIRKRSRPTTGLPEGFFDPGTEKEPSPALHPIEMQIPSRPATPSKPPESIIVPKKVEPQVDEDEWLAFEADIASAEAQVTAANEAVISAPAMSADDIKNRTAEEEYNARKERQEAEIEGDKEDAARKMEDELEEMESLEARVRRLREKREELRKKESIASLNKAPPVTADLVDIMDEEDDEEEDEDEWFR